MTPGVKRQALPLLGFLQQRLQKECAHMGCNVHLLPVTQQQTAGYVQGDGWGLHGEQDFEMCCVPQMTHSVRCGNVTVCKKMPMHTMAARCIGATSQRFWVMQN
jgi:hypothetical protein